jgi:hypothetical protein
MAAEQGDVTGVRQFKPLPAVIITHKLAIFGVENLIP